MKAIEIGFSSSQTVQCRNNKEWQDRIEVALKGLPSLKAYTFVPSQSRALSKEELAAVADRLKADGITAMIALESQALQSGTECQTSSENRIYDMPEFGQQARTVCSQIDDWIFRITITDVVTKKTVVASELRASEQGILDSWSTSLGASRARQMIDKMMKSIAVAKVF